MVDRAELLLAAFDAVLAEVVRRVEETGPDLREQFRCILFALPEFRRHWRG